MPSSSRRQRGDTIVEVLICILIISMVLSGAYVTTHQSVKGVRNSQEHAEALKLVQAQLEQIRANADTPSRQVFSVSAPFCMIDGDPVPTSKLPEGLGCKQDASGNATTAEPAYAITINRKSAGTGSLFSVEAEWDAITGTKAQETLFYKVYQ